MKTLWVIFVAAVAVFVLPFTLPAYAQTPTPTPAPAPDMANFGYPTVAVSRVIQPTETVTLTAGNQSVTITAGSYASPVRFELLTGDTAFWQRQLNDPSQVVIATHAFRVTDLTTNQLVARPNTPLQYRITDPRLSSRATIYLATAATPPSLTNLAARVTFSDQTLSIAYVATTLGWFVTVPAAAAPVTGDISRNTMLYTFGPAGLAVLAAGTYLLLRSRRRTA